jgi:sugar lactone lactonase YvrE
MAKLDVRSGARRAAAALIVLAGAAALAGCWLGAEGGSATLEIHLETPGGGAAKSLAPQGPGMEIAAYDLFAAGPDGAEFSALGVSSSVYMKSGLRPGSWTVHAVGKNAGGVSLVQSPEAAVTLALAETTEVSLVCVPLEGQGTLSIDLAWPAESVVRGAVEATLAPDGGPAAPIAFTVSDTNPSAGYDSAKTLDSGYYTLNVLLRDAGMSNYLVWSTTESVYIFKDQVTAADWVLTAADTDEAPAPGMTLRLVTDVRMPLGVTLAGVPASLVQGQSASATAASVPEAASWRWFIDGVEVAGQTASAISFGAALGAGGHTIAAIAEFDGRRGSAAARFAVEAAPVPGVSALAGSGFAGDAEGAGAAAAFSGPLGVATDAAGNIYVADTANNKIRKVSPEGVVGTFAGSGAEGSADGPGLLATFTAPRGLAVDASGNVYVADTGANKLRKITPEGVVSTLAGSGAAGSADGAGAAATFSAPCGLAIWTDGTVYVCDRDNHKIRAVDTDGVVTTISGTGVSGSTDGAKAVATFNAPEGIVASQSGPLYVADTGNHKIRRVTQIGSASTIAGSGTATYKDGFDTIASFSAPRGIALDADGNLIVADAGNNRLRLVSAAGEVSTLAGTGAEGFGNGSLAEATFHGPAALAIGPSGELYVADSLNHALRKVVR